jgi:hypothetical protein
MRKRDREIYRLRDFPGPSEAFKVTIPAGEDFVIRSLDARYPQNSVQVFGSLSDDGRLAVQAGPFFEIELIGTNDERWRRRVAAEKKKKSNARKAKAVRRRG